jgi:glucose-6-phosphate 1-epimerase
MNVSTHTHAAGFPIYTLTEADNEVVISSFGAQILSWTRGGVPIVFENRGRAVIDGKTPYRGGAPICFPYFGMGTLMPMGTTLKPQHGGARTTVWDSTSIADSGLFLKTWQPSATGYGPTEFTCELSFALSDDFRIQATVRNVGEHEAPFQLAIHTYWATEAPTTATITGLGNRYLDNLLGLTEQREDDSSAPHPTPVDRVYLDSGDEQMLTTNRYALTVSTAGCAGAVLWNPGPNHTIADLGSPDFICLESGQIDPSKLLKPGETHVIDVSYQAQIT